MINNEKSPSKKIISAIFSNCSPLRFSFLNDKNERTLLNMNKKIATAVNSSISVLPSRFNNFNEVSTIKQIPSKLEDVVRM